MTEKFITVHDLKMTLLEAALWGKLGRTPETYPANKGVIPQDAALNHIVLLLLDRRDYDGATQYADRILDEGLRAAMLTLIDYRRNK